ncbi:hypothetical protein C1645_817774 [Glomus cerebriforme]|uniref:P-loop containing nucleoside triphosphate hydrolase protein n=1 Tax=Glomus cerebriforme TaxID=658196 RepID=A0A397T8Q5_9GLOM|nr:hypothetical protein C1645_817774 [Glomus cerebriforme]
MTNLLTQVLLRDIEKLYLNSYDYNVIIKVGEGLNIKKFKAHSNILCARSSYFQAALSANWVKREDNIIYLDKPNISPKVFEIILNYIYTSKCVIEADNILLDVLVAADELILLELITYLEDYIISKKKDWIHKNLVQVWKISSQHESFSKLQPYCNELIDDKPECLFESEDFITIDKITLEELLQREDINIGEEIEIWNKVIKWGIEKEPKLEKEISKWTQIDFEELKERLKDLLPHIRFYTIPGSEYYQYIRPYKKILERDFLNELKKFYIDENCEPPQDVLLHRSPLSKIIHPSQFEIIAKWIDSKEFIKEELVTYKFKLLLRGSRDGMNSDKFHQICDNKGSTLVIVKIDGTRKIIGGYNPFSWTSSGIWKVTNKSFIFSFKNRRDFNDYILSNVKLPLIAISDGHFVEFGDGDLAWFSKSYSHKAYDKKILETRRDYIKLTLTLCQAILFISLFFLRIFYIEVVLSIPDYLQYAGKNTLDDSDLDELPNEFTANELHNKIRQWRSNNLLYRMWKGDKQDIEWAIFCVFGILIGGLLHVFAISQHQYWGCSVLQSSVNSINLMAVDANRISQFMIWWASLIEGPIQIGIGLFFLYKLISSACLIGILVLVIILPIQRWTVKYFSENQENLMKTRDYRVALMNEVLQGIRMIKFNSWEKNWISRITNARKIELKFLKKSFILMSVFNLLWIASPILITTVTLQAIVSFYRIEKFLISDENKNITFKSDDKIGFENATITWNKPEENIEESFIMKDLNIEFPIEILSGPTGSGKTLLLMALLEERYSQVVKSCVLGKDFETFADGDLTEIGEQGVTLSGGQKQRIALARAVYSRAKHILIDDALSAVDTNTANYLINECISGPLMNKRTRILVTHHLNLTLSVANYIIMINNGKIVDKGEISELYDNDSINIPKEIISEDIISESSNNTTNSPLQVLSIKENSEEILVRETSRIINLDMEVIEDEKMVNDMIIISEFDGDNKPKVLVKEEEKESGTIKLNIYLKYFESNGSYLFWIITSILFISTRAGH